MLIIVVNLVLLGMALFDAFFQEVNIARKRLMIASSSRVKMEELAQTFLTVLVSVALVPEVSKVQPATPT